MTTRLAPIPPHTSAVQVDAEEDAETLLDHDARLCIEQFGQWVAAHTGHYGLGVTSLRVRRWQSVEASDWIQLILDVDVTGTPSHSLAAAL